jgi:hypothetical protein
MPATILNTLVPDNNESAGNRHLWAHLIDEDDNGQTADEVWLNLPIVLENDWTYDPKKSVVNAADKEPAFTKRGELDFNIKIKSIQYTTRMIDFLTKEAVGKRFEVIVPMGKDGDLSAGGKNQEQIRYVPNVEFPEMINDKAPERESNIAIQCFKPPVVVTRIYVAADPEAEPPVLESDPFPEDMQAKLELSDTGYHALSFTVNPDERPFDVKAVEKTK